MRADFDLPSSIVVSSWPACTSDCGIFVDGVRILDLAVELEQEAQAAQDVASYFRCRECREGVAALRNVNEMQLKCLFNVCEAIGHLPTIGEYVGPDLSLNSSVGISRSKVVLTVFHAIFAFLQKRQT